MRFSGIGLVPALANLPNLREPLLIASSRHTTNEAEIKGWKDIDPAALTLKTCTKEPEQEDKKSLRRTLLPGLVRYGKSYYCDGPKHEELLSYEAENSLLKIAKEVLPNTLIVGS